MIAAVLHEAKQLRLEDHDIPVPSLAQVLVKVRAVGICGSDLSYYFKGKSGDFAIREPFIPGHEVAGEIAALGPGTDATVLAPGQHVAVNPGVACGQCRFCLKGMPNHCLHMRFMGSASTFPHMQGTFREYIAVSAAQCIPVPAHISFAQASMAEPLAVVLHALRQVGSLVGARTLIVGCGPIGCLLIAAARHAGAHHIVAVDLAAPALAMARQLGADATVLASDLATIEPWSQNRGTFDVVIEASGSPAGLDTALRSAAAGSLVLQVGNLPAGQSPVAANLVMAKELRYHGSFRFTTDDYRIAVEEIVSGRIDVTALMTHRFPLAQADGAFLMAADRSQSMKVHLLCE